MYRRLFVATILLGFFVRLGEGVVAFGPSNPFWNWLEASWTVAWLSVLVVGLWCYRVGDRFDFDSGRTRFAVISTFLCGPTVGYSIGSALLIGVGLEGALTPVGAVVTGAVLGVYIALASIAGVTAHAASDAYIIGPRLATFGGVLGLIAVIATVFGHGYGRSDTGLFLVCTVYMFSLVRLQRRSGSGGASPQ